MAPLARLGRRFDRLASDPRKVLVLDSAVFVVLCGLVAFVIYFVLQTNAALCKFRGDLGQRAAQAHRFLATQKGDLHLDGTTITRAQIVAQVAGQDATLKSLDGLDC